LTSSEHRLVALLFYRRLIYHFPDWGLATGFDLPRWGLALNAT